jgi:BMFP domain-containing protein YqiC
MQTDNRLLDDLSRVATGAFAALTGVREEVEGRVRDQFEKILARMDMVTREEFEAVRAMAAHARAEQEALEARLVKLESQLAETAGHAKPPRRVTRKAVKKDISKGEDAEAG